MFARESFANVNALFGVKPANLSLENVLEAARRVISFLPKEESLPQVKIGRIIKLEEKIAELAQRIQDNIQTCFSDFSGLAYRQAGQNKCGKSREELNEMKTEIIVSFLALLELVKQGIAMADQENVFGNISVKKYG